MLEKTLAHMTLMTISQWLRHAWAPQIVLLHHTLADKARQYVLRSSRLSDIARQAPISHTCLNLPHTSRKVQIFCWPTKNRLVRGGLYRNFLSEQLVLMVWTSATKQNLFLTSVGIEPTTSGLGLPLLCRLSYEVGQRKTATIIGGGSRRRESKGTYECCVA